MDNDNEHNSDDEDSTVVKNALHKQSSQKAKSSDASKPGDRVKSVRMVKRRSSAFAVKRSSTKTTKRVSINTGETAIGVTPSDAVQIEMTSR